MDIPLPTRVCRMVWSPFSNRTAMISVSDANSRKLYLGDAEGKNLKRLPIEENVHSVDWSRDGQYLVYVAGGDGVIVGGDVFIMELSTGKKRQLTDDNLSWEAIWFEPEEPVQEKDKLTATWGKIKAGRFSP